MNIKEKLKNEVGVIVGRFQIHQLHDAHKDLIDKVLSLHSKVILFLGTTSAIGTKKNPLDFITRKFMIEEIYGDKISVILPIEDKKCDEMWSLELDKKIREIFPKESVVLYGSRDSFISFYKGNFETIKLEPTSYISATDIRNKLQRNVIKDEKFRAGIIYSIYNQYPIVHPTIDVIIRRESKILLGRKASEKEWRLIGGFVDPSDESLEHSAKREVLEETGLEITNLKIIGSCKINDWRYRNVPDRSIMTTLFEAQYLFGHPEPKDDIVELKWEDFNSIHEILVEEHKKLINLYLNKNVK